MPAIRHPELLSAATKNRKLAPFTDMEVWFATGWRDFEMERPNDASPWSREGEEHRLYSAGWHDAKTLIAALHGVLEAA